MLRHRSSQRFLLCIPHPVAQISTNLDFTVPREKVRSRPLSQIQR